MTQEDIIKIVRSVTDKATNSTEFLPSEKAHAIEIGIAEAIEEFVNMENIKLNKRIIDIWKRTIEQGVGEK